ncbi:adenylyl-sulfate kinase [Butyrivibrio sp. MC2013]|uniref:adenylyl-sulfate kinase n=1 Tax=Butyrivibrio sp. MC2013 TaxID=1280686 RepID=UPI00040F394D|nr:adenylyl-sulfate kinase [Butyrivibrio sp. MC2013]
MSKGIVYWLTGLPNSGKTTIGTALYYSLRKKREDVIILDGDILKEIMSGGDKIDYKKSDRLVRAKRYAMMAKLLADQGALVIVCTIAMFDEVREWNRENIKGYIEVFITCSEEVLQNRDKKKLYVPGHKEQYPKNPDIVIDNSGVIPIMDLVQRIEEITPQKIDDYDRDKQYWNEYYKSGKLKKNVPSSFAKWINSYIGCNQHILELGCGNGRDSLYFIEQGHNVIAVDGSDCAIAALNKETVDLENALFVCDDFVKCHTLYEIPFDCIYSRFTLHAITEEQEDELLNNVCKALRFGGVFCVEARTIHDDIYGKGHEIAKNTYIYEGHFRRFIDCDEFYKKLVNLGFEIEYYKEMNGLSKTDNSDPMLLRCIARL